MNYYKIVKSNFEDYGVIPQAVGMIDGLQNPLNPANESTGLPVQMSDEWIENVINRMLKDTEPQHIQELGQLLFIEWSNSSNRHKFTKIISTVDTHTNEFVIAKLGYIYKGW